MQTQLCLTCNEAAAGYLKAHHAGSEPRPEIVPLPLSLIRTPLDFEVPKLNGTSVFSWLNDVGRCEFYVDPDPNSQLFMTLLLTMAVSVGIDHRRLHLRHGPVRWGYIDAGTPPDHAALPVPVEDEDLIAAMAIWSAYSSPTPEAWLGLQHEYLARFPYMKRTKVALLDDLPRWDTGLGTCERLALNSIGTHGSRVDEIARVFSRHLSPLIGPPQIGAMLTSLASGPTPLIEGLNRRSREDTSRDDADAWDALRGSHVRLTDVGRDVNAGERDFVEVQGIDRWWGGTRLKGYTCWRWDNRAGVLIPPAQP